MSPSTSVTVLVAAGRIRLQSSLPEATGRLQIVGSAPPPEPDAGSADDGGGIVGGGELVPSIMSNYIVRELVRS